jgi:ketosteroid isomerase-like protein
MQSNTELLKAAYAAFNARDMDAVLALMRPDVDWANGMTGGRVSGREQVRAYWRGQWETLDPRVEPLRIDEDASGRSVVTVHQVVRDLAGAVLLDQIVRHAYSIDDGLIVRMDILESGEAPESKSQA